MTENEVIIEHAGARLAGTVVTPSGGRCPTVLMLHGSGPMDRNEDMPGQRLSIFDTFAERLVRHGIASVRFDKRGCGASTGDFKTAGVRVWPQMRSRGLIGLTGRTSAIQSESSC